MAIGVKQILDYDDYAAIPPDGKRWEQRELGSGELSELIHKFHQGPARDLYLRYNTPYLRTSVAYAIVAGILDRTAIPAELLDHLAGAIEFYEREQRTS